MNPIHCILTISALLLAGCATVPPPVVSATSSAPLRDYKSALIEFAVERGFLIRAEGEHHVELEGDAGAAAAFWFMDLRSGERPRTVISVTLTERDGGTRVSAAAWMTRPAYRARMNLDSPDQLARVRWWLECAGADAEHRARPGEPPKPPSAPPRPAKGR